MPREFAPEPVLSEVVRQRLAALLDEVPARRAIRPPADFEAPALASAPEMPSTSVGSARASVTPARASVASARASVAPAPPSVPAEAGISPPGHSEPPAPGADRGQLAAGWGRAAWEFTRGHLVAVGIVLLTGCLWAGYSVLQARSTPVERPAGTAPTVVASPTPTPPPSILVHVLGAVAHPGVVELDEGARVQDAILAAGGLTEDADPGELNLAAVVSDGAQLVIGTRKQPRGEIRGEGGGGGSGGGGSADGSRKLSLNKATQAEFEALPGVGPVTAGRIVAWREEHGKFTRIEELQEVDGIGPKTYAQLAPLVRL
jgi:competence protein ComEA